MFTKGLPKTEVINSSSDLLETLSSVLSNLFMGFAPRRTICLVLNNTMRSCSESCKT